MLKRGEYAAVCVCACVCMTFISPQAELAHTLVAVVVVKEVGVEMGKTTSQCTLGNQWNAKRPQIQSELSMIKYDKLN